MEIDYFIVGTQKSGTTSLQRLLSLSPEIKTHPSLEFTFFSIDKERIKGERFFRRYYFSKKNSSKKKLAKHSTACYNINEIKLAHEINPQMQFILIFRNPVYRAFSSYLMEYSRNLYSNSFEDAIQTGFINPNSFEHRVFLSFGMYDKMMNQLYNEIPKEQIHIVLFEEFMNAPIDTTNRLLEKLSLKHINSSHKHLYNGFKLPRSYFIGLFYKKMRHSKIKKPVKLLMNGNLWNTVVKSIYKLSFKKVINYPQLSIESEKTLFYYYQESILNFEKITGIQTNWLKNNPDN